MNAKERKKERYQEIKQSSSRDSRIKEKRIERKKKGKKIIGK